MALFNFAQFFRQAGALCRKNLLLVVVRRPVGFLLLTYVIPLGLLALLLSIPSFISSSNTFGVGSPAPIKDLASTLNKKLVIVRPPSLGADVDRVIDSFTRPLNKSLLHFLDDERELPTMCTANLRGISDCHAAVSFVDSPESQGTVAKPLSSHNRIWQYIIRADPARSDTHFDASRHKSDQEELYMPLQIAVNNAITNSTATPEVFMFTHEKQEEHRRRQLEGGIVAVGQIYAFALFACYCFIIYRFTSFITADREAGVSQLVDAMGGGSAAMARVLSWLLVFDIACLPCFIAAGILYWHMLFPSSSVGLVVGWQVLLGLAVNSSTVFAAAFFKKARVSAVYVMGAFIFLSIGAQVSCAQKWPSAKPPEAYILSLLFPSSNHVFFTQSMGLWELSGKGADISQTPPGNEIFETTLSLAPLLGFLVLNILFYPLLAIVIERTMHGIDFRKRSFVYGATVTQSTGVVAETFDLEKRFMPNLVERLFCCGTRKTVTAVDGVSLQGHRGQILCLLGPNGSGKTTTLHMMSGFISPTAGSVKLNAAPSQIGICPQRNTLWEELTVREHVSIWSQIKGGQESSQDLDQLISSCDLDMKRASLADTLSGGQKRKLQLACMFVGNSTVCLIDECTSGLDPLSRRIIWEILLKQRSKRSIVFTTHFLDEVDVLADHIVILSKGKVRCQGPVAELKNLHGGGYKVLVPLSAPKPPMRYPSRLHQDSVVYTVPDSLSAAELSSHFSAAGVADVGISGPQVEDVFLNVADEPDLGLGKSQADVDVPGLGFQMTPGRVISFWRQVWVLFRKRLTILKRFWWPYVYVLAIPLIATLLFRPMLESYVVPSCASLEPFIDEPTATSYSYEETCDLYGDCPKVAVAPASAQDSIRDMIEKRFQLVSGVGESRFNDFVAVQDTRGRFIDYIKDNRNDKKGVGGVYMGSGNEAPVIAYLMKLWGGPSGPEMINLYSQMASNVEITSTQAGFAQARQAGSGSAILYAVFLTLVHAIYPAVFVLYPALEKAHKVRALEYANGVRRGPLWVAYGLFDFMFVLVVAVGTAATMTAQFDAWNGPVGVMVPILALYGLAATLLGYVVAHFASGPPKAFLAMFSVNMVMYTTALVSFSIGSGYADASQMDSVALGVAFGVNLLVPIGNVFRALLLLLNVLQVGCRDGRPTPAASIYAFGGPMLYLVLQVAVLLLIIVWIEGDTALFRRKGKVLPTEDMEQDAKPRSREVAAEAARAERSESDLLRALHISKSFGSIKALDDVTLGLPENDVMALIGPNGAGKSTLVNLVQSELSPDHGQILLKGEDSRTRSAQRHLGVCPQYDALDLMNTREHLSFYARIKGVSDVKSNVWHVMDSLNLTPHASTPASKLSGGNKRKLSLAIALMGTPPVLVLDEPTSAMDAVAKRQFWRLIQKTTADRSVLLTTHSMEEADTLATRAAIMSKRILAVGTTRALRARYSNQSYVSLLLASAPDSTPAEMGHVAAWVRGQIPGAQLERDLLGGQVRFTVPGADDARPVADLILLLERNKRALALDYYSVEGATLERVFLSVVRENNVPEEDGAPARRWRCWPFARR